MLVEMLAVRTVKPECRTKSIAAPATATHFHPPKDKTMDYINACGASAVEDAPRSPHHAAMLLLEQRVSQLSASISNLEGSLEAALRQAEPQPTNGDVVKDSGSTPKVIAHVDAVIRVVDSCISRVENLGNRLVI